MSMVTRLVPRVEPKDSALNDCVHSLSLLLQNSEPHVSDPTLKCFMMLSDRFIRRGRDPAPIAEKGLLPELIGRLKSLNAGGPSSSSSSTSGPVGSTPDRPSGHTVTTIITLLSTLCRGSPTITSVRSLCATQTYTTRLCVCVSFDWLADWLGGWVAGWVWV